MKQTLVLNINQNVVLHVRIIILIDLMVLVLPIRDPGFGSREVGETIQPLEVPTQIQEVPTHILERAELNYSNQGPSFSPDC